MVEIDIISLFPEYFRGPFEMSILGRAIKAGLLDIRHVDLRVFGIGRHRKVDDRPFGGGPGMILKPEPLHAAISSVRRESSHVILLSPQGKTLTAQKCRELAKKPHLICVCGHYEGVDERIVTSQIDEEVSIGDYVLTNGALAAIVLIDAMARFIPGVLGNGEGAAQDSFEAGVLDYPHYTQPVEFGGMKVPEVLLSGHHENIKNWREHEALKKTCAIRPELYERHMATKSDKK